MREIFFALDWSAQPLYVLLAVLILWYGYRFLQARKERSMSYFELERDLASRSQSNALTTIIIAIQVIVLLVGVQLRAVPFLEAERDLDVVVAAAVADDVQDIDFDTPTPGPPDPDAAVFDQGTPLGIEADIIVLTPTLTPTPVGTIVPGAPPVEGCEDERAQLQVPANGQRVFQPIVVRGTAFTSNFIEAKLEVSGPESNGQYLVAGTVDSEAQQVTDIGQFSPAGYEAGVYDFRLTVFDITGQLVASCKVTIYISDLPRTPTSTPIAGSGQ